MNQKNLTVIFLAVRANTEEIKPVIYNLKTSFFGKLPCHICQTLEVRIYYFFALCTNQMRMRVWFIPIIAVASIGESQLKNLVKFLKQRYRLVYCGTAGCREIDFYLFKHCFNCWMCSAGCELFENCNALRSYAALPFSELFKHNIKAVFWCGHGF